MLLVSNTTVMNTPSVLMTRELSECGMSLLVSPPEGSQLLRVQQEHACSSAELGNIKSLIMPGLPGAGSRPVLDASSCGTFSMYLFCICLCSYLPALGILCSAEDGTHSGYQ
jgi:hypothetical protein